MCPIEFPEQTVVFAKNQPPYRPLPAHRVESDTTGRMTCCWQLTWGERFMLFITGRLWQQVLTFQQPLQPQLLLASKPILKNPDAEMMVSGKVA